MDVLLRLISCVEPPPLRLETLTVWDKWTKSLILLFFKLIFSAVIIRYFSQQWLNEQKLAQRLIELIHPERDEEVGENFRSLYDQVDHFVIKRSTQKHLKTAYRLKCLHVFILFPHRGSPMHLRLCVILYVWAETRPISSKRFHSLTLCWQCWSRKWKDTFMRPCSRSVNGMKRQRHALVFLQARVCGAVVAEYVLRREDWELHCQWDSSSSHPAGNQEACVSERL